MSQFVERFSQPEYREELISFYVGLKLRGFKRMADRSRMNREVYVRCCGRLEVKFLRSTRLQRSDNKKAGPLLALPVEYIYFIVLIFLGSVFYRASRAMRCIILSS